MNIKYFLVTTKMENKATGDLLCKNIKANTVTFDTESRHFTFTNDDHQLIAKIPEYVVAVVEAMYE